MTWILQMKTFENDIRNNYCMSIIALLVKAIQLNFDNSAIDREH